MLPVRLHGVTGTPHLNLTRNKITLYTIFYPSKFDKKKSTLYTISNIVYRVFFFLSNLDGALSACAWGMKLASIAEKKNNPHNIGMKSQRKHLIVLRNCGSA